MIHASDETYEKLITKHGEECIVLFHVEFAGPSILMRDALEVYCDNEEIEMIVVDCNNCPDTAKFYDIKAAPTTMHVRDGEVSRSIKGYLTSDQIAEFF